MSENGKNGEPPQKADKRADRDANGHFLPGHSITSPGRPKGSLDFVATCRIRAKEEGTTLEAAVGDAFIAVAKAAKNGDVAACKLLLDRLCGLLPAAGIEVNVDARSITIGPPAPDAASLREQVQRLLEEENDGAS